MPETSQPYQINLDDKFGKSMLIDGHIDVDRVTPPIAGSLRVMVESPSSAT